MRGTPSSNLAGLLAVQQALRSRFDDFRRALDRRDVEAYRLGLTDFHNCLRRWTEAEEKALCPRCFEPASRDGTLNGSCASNGCSYGS